MISSYVKAKLKISTYICTNMHYINELKPAPLRAWVTNRTAKLCNILSALSQIKKPRNIHCMQFPCHKKYYRLTPINLFSISILKGHLKGIFCNKNEELCSGNNNGEGWRRENHFELYYIWSSACNGQCPLGISITCSKWIRK